VQIGKNWGLTEWYPGRKFEAKSKPGNGGAEPAEKEAYEEATPGEGSSSPSES
jgi:hypothetical protein